MTLISILGCGWLGVPLAEFLLENEFKIKGSTTTESKITDLKNLGIIPFLIALKANEGSGNIKEFLADSEILVIDIPPKLRGTNPENFVSKIQNLMPFIEQSNIKKVIFVSSISVFADNNQTVTNTTLPNPDSESGQQLFAAENLFQKNKNFETTIVRFGGLIGKDRHPIYSLSGKNNLPNPAAPINLIHQKDCIKIIYEIIKYNKFNQIINAVADFHPTKKQYYTQKAIELDLPKPQFDEENPSFGKTIQSDIFDFNYTKI
jgi:nucleoside-diphosphate-sugar epimerase